MIKADFVRAFSGEKLPFFQELRAKHPNALVEVTITYEEVVSGTHVEKILSISHRWMEPTQPDPDGEQLKAIKAFLGSSKGEQIELVWIDGSCMPQDQPQGSRTPQDTADFKIVLSQVCRAFRAAPLFSPLAHSSYHLPVCLRAQVNMLFLGTSVLILLDLSYVSRFWTQFEAWLSMQFATPNGLKSAIGTATVRHHIVCIQNAAEQSELYTKALTTSWADKTPLQAHDFLSKPDVTVTNASDKEGQLPKIKALDATVQGAFQAIDAQLQQRVIASAEVVARTKAALEAFESENDVQAGERNPLKAAAVQAEREAAAARATKEKHAQAIAHGVIPMVMEREEGRRIVEEARKAEAEAKAAKERAVAEARAAKERAAAEKREANAARTSQFQDGPCKECCMPLACCCVSADGNKVYGCVPTKYDYWLPLCLHTCLCPQQGGSPCPSGHNELKCADYFLFPLFNNACCTCIQEPGMCIQGYSHESCFRKPKRDSNPHPARPAPASPRAPASCLTVIAVAIFVVRAHSTSGTGNGRERRARAHLLETGRRAAPSTARAGGRAHTRPVAAAPRPVPHTAAQSSPVAPHDACAFLMMHLWEFLSSHLWLDCRGARSHTAYGLTPTDLHSDRRRHAHRQASDIIQ